MLEPSEIPRGVGLHEEEFLARYGRLRASALRLTAGDRGAAEDLVHDAFVQFTLARPELGRVENLDGYLYQMLRNLHLSQLRRARRRGEDAPAVVEYDSAEFALRAYADPRDSIRVQDELRQVCRYACLRKETSKAGSVLILRFMHGYYPGEIAQVSRSTREAVEERLRTARGEARQFLKDPSSLRFIKREAASAPTPAPTGFAQTHEELLADLRRRVFDSRRGECLTKETLSEIYDGGSRAPDCATLAHVVSCPRCIDEVNSLNGLPPLSERYPTDSLGVEPRSGKGGGDDDGTRGDGGTGGGGDGTGTGGHGTGGANAEEAGRCRRRARDVYEHRPRELCVAVNGRLLGTQKVASVLSEQRLNVGADEGVSFVEVFSEQDVRLLYLDPAAWPAEADGGRVASVRLSDRRTLEARLSYDGSMPTVQVVYRDPLMADAYATQSAAVADEAARVGNLSDDEAQHESARHRVGTLPHVAGWRRLSERLSKLSGLLARPSTHFRPGALAAALAVLVVAALLFTRLYVPPVSAAELLRRASAAEQSAPAPDVVSHRTVFVEEERREGRRSVVTRRRVETWQGGASGIRVRRLFDEQGRLTAGELTNSDGTSELLRRGSPPLKAGAATAAELLAAGELWRVEPSAGNFAALAPADDAMKVEDRLGTYVLRREAPAADAGIVRAELWLNKADLHAFRMTLAVRRGNETVEYRLIEGGFERRRAGEVPPTVYQLEPELLGASRVMNDESGAVQTQAGDGGQPSHVESQPAPVASAELEVEVAYLLNKIKANLGEQVSMGRTTGGALRVEALVESEERKGAILSALGPVLNNPAVVVEVSTVAEALAKRGPARDSSVTEREVVVEAGRIPADGELRAHFAARLSDPSRVDAEIKQFAARAMNHSRQALLHASALKRMANRFTPTQARALSEDARAKWLAMVREHAGAYAREVAALRAQLSSVFGGGGAGGGAEGLGDADAAQAAERLLQLSYAQDSAVRSAFTISEDGRSASAVKSPQFWRTLAASERLAAEIQKAYER
jgi:RNA polymerase sigma factor (sigma-70 family)